MFLGKSLLFDEWIKNRCGETFPFELKSYVLLVMII